MEKLSRPLSGVGSRFYYACYLRMTPARYSLMEQSPPKPLLKTRPLLAPGTEPYVAFVPYGIYKGPMDDAPTILEAWLRKKRHEE